MVSVNSEYYAARGIAFCQYGFENFEEIMPKDRFRNLMWAIAETKGYTYIESGKFLNWIMMVCGRELRQKDPICSDVCEYRLYPDRPALQKNALRIETFSFSQRCGKLLKDGHNGGHWCDYHACKHPVNPSERNGWRGW